MSLYQVKSIWSSRSRSQGMGAAQRYLGVGVGVRSFPFFKLGNMGGGWGGGEGGRRRAKAALAVHLVGRLQVWMAFGLLSYD